MVRRHRNSIDPLRAGALDRQGHRREPGRFLPSLGGSFIPPWNDLVHRLRSRVVRDAVRRLVLRARSVAPLARVVRCAFHAVAAFLRRMAVSGASWQKLFDRLSMGYSCAQHAAARQFRRDGDAGALLAAAQSSRCAHLLAGADDPAWRDLSRLAGTGILRSLYRTRPDTRLRSLWRDV